MTQCFVVFTRPKMGNTYCQTIFWENGGWEVFLQFVLQKQRGPRKIKTEKVTI